MIECKEYSLTELKKVLNITKWQWEERKEDLLLYLKLFFDYEIVIRGRSYCFIIKEQYSEYEPLPRKTKYQEAMDFYISEVDHILQYKPRNTGSNLAREITAKNNKFKHRDTTAANYIRPYLKKNYTVKDREWCEINYETYSYDKITPEQLKFLNKQFSKYLNSTAIAEAMADAEAGYSTKEEAYDKLKNNYDSAIQAFKDEYGFRPYKAGELIKNAWVIEDEETTNNN